jgi:short-subunit dehydrogenase
MARIWAADGRDLALCARRLPELERLRDELVEAHPDRSVVIKQLDVGDREAVRQIFAEAAEELNGLDRVVANAGAGGGEPIGTGSGDANQVVARTNFLGVLHQAEAALAHFRAAEAGHLVIISSMAALRGLRGRLAVYSATKAAVANLGEGLRSEFWDSPIAVTTVYPGYIRTGMTDASGDSGRAAPLGPATAELVRVIEAERARAFVPAWPWVPLSAVMRFVPLGAFRRLGG